MAKRFTDTTIWEEDWFFELSPEYKLFWFYIKDNCDYAGIWKPKMRAFKSATDIEIDLDTVFKLLNTDKQRIRKLSNGHWLIEDFFFFQYGKSSRSINLANRVHRSIFNIYEKNKIPVSSINGIDIVITENGEKFNVLEYERGLYGV